MQKFFASAWNRGVVNVHSQHDPHFSEKLTGPGHLAGSCDAVFLQSLIQLSGNLNMLEETGLQLDVAPCLNFI